MRRALGLALLLAALAATPAWAAVNPPTVLDFEDQRVGASVGISGNPGEVYAGRTDVLLSDSDACASVAQPGGNFGPRFLDDSCVEMEFRFPRGPQAVVSFFTKVTPFGESPDQTRMEIRAFGTSGAPAGSRDIDVTAGAWQSAVLRSNDGTASIARVTVSTPVCCYGMDFDDVGFSPFPQPHVEITGGPGEGDPTFTFAGSDPERMTFTCRLDAGPPEPCTSPKSYPGLADGGHTFEVNGRDRWGESAQASQRFVISRPVVDRDFDGVLDGSDNCPDNANPGQGDSDSDGVGDACELLPSGNSPVEAGKAAKVKLLSGEVFVKLPAGSSASAFTSGLRVPFQSSGFLPLKGVAAVPMGSTLDTRRGEVSITAAVNGQRPTSRRQLRREARFRAGIFAIRQARKKRRAKRSKRIPPRAELASPAGAEAPCRARGAAKGIAVRSLSTTAKGVFRTVGGAATATPAKGRTSTFITTDRCDGTVTEVGRGRVAVIAKRSGKRRVVRAGRAYIVRARLFAARKGRSRP
jgi:hypothetical protein